MNDENIRWMNAKITESNRYVRVEFANSGILTMTQIKILNEFAEKNNLTLTGFVMSNIVLYAVFIKNNEKLITNTENKSMFNVYKYYSKW